MAKRDKKARSKASSTKITSSQPPGGKATWKLLDRGSVLVGGLLAQRATAVAWRGLSGKKPPTAARHPEVSTREALLWAVIAGALTELVKTGVRRGTSTYWVRSTGELPPGMKPLKVPDLAKEAAEVKVEKAAKKLKRR